MAEQPPKPTAADLKAALAREVPDVIAPGLAVLLVGINPGLYSGATGHHFARPGNRFWPALHLGGWTERVLSPAEKDLLPGYGLGITNLVSRTTAAEADLLAEEVRAGAEVVAAKVRAYGPRCVAFLGMGAYRTAFGVKRAAVGQQEAGLEGAEVWVLPNPSGLNAHYRLADFGRLFRELREAMGVPAAGARLMRRPPGARGPRAGRGRR